MEDLKEFTLSRLHSLRDWFGDNSEYSPAKADIMLSKYYELLAMLKDDAELKINGVPASVMEKDLRKLADMVLKIKDPSNFVAELSGKDIAFLYEDTVFKIYSSLKII